MIDMPVIRPFQPAGIPPCSLLGARPQLSPDEATAVATWPSFDLEIGSGTGLYAMQFAARFPDRRLVAIEHGHERFKKLARRWLHHGRPHNVLPVQADAEAWVTHHVSVPKVERVLIHYPNPYPKPRQRNKRWYAMPFFSQLLAAMVAEGQVLVATNDEAYAREAMFYFQSVWNMQRVSLRMFEAADVSLPRTHFEKKYLERGERCFEVVAFKRGAYPSQDMKPAADSGAQLGSHHTVN